MELAEKQLQEFSDQGFVNVGRIFDERQLATISAEYDRLVTQEAQVLGNEKDGFFPYRAMLNFRSQELAKFILHPPLVAMARQILGDEIRFWWDQGINKRPGSRSPIRWHQDNGYQRGRTQEFLTCWLALDASDLRNGGLEVIPGSHKGGQRLHGWEGVHAVIPGEGLDARLRQSAYVRCGCTMPATPLRPWLSHLGRASRGCSHNSATRTPR